MSDTIQHLREILGHSVDSTPERVSIYFKTSPGDYAEHDRFMGITVPVLRKIAKRFMTISLGELGFLIPENDGVYYEENNSWRASLWDKYYTQMPEQRRQSVERSVIVKRA